MLSELVEIPVGYSNLGNGVSNMPISLLISVNKHAESNTRFIGALLALNRIDDDTLNYLDMNHMC